jgi:subtilisin family serine protease
VQQVAAAAGRIRQRSRWLNAVSVNASREEIAALSRLPCVRRLDLVERFRRNGSEAPGEVQPAPAPAPTGRKVEKHPSPAPHSLDYGPSLGQLQLLGIPALHDQGLSGQGVLIGHFDNGYLRFGHQAFATMQVVAQYDFVDHDPNPVGGATEFFGVHGLQTVSVLGGYAPGNLIGPAYGASFILARTEDDESETPLEEDNWVAALEWADSIGVDVISSSVGYLDFDLGSPSYTWSDMDGDTAAITRAADLAVGRGIVVVNSAGNGGQGIAGQNTLLAPADGDSVITVGGTWSDGSRYNTSSVGPTTDSPPRIKPDVMAQGALVTVADPSAPTVYGVGTGTSFACPLVAGVVALLLQANPAATPMQLAAALRSTASRAAAPDNLNGWGVVNAPAALAQINLAVQPASWTDLKKAYR